MRTNWLHFSNAVKQGDRDSGLWARILPAGILLACLFLPGIAGGAEPSPAPLPSFPVREPVARSPQQGVRVGDRLTLQVEVSPTLIPPGAGIQLIPAETERNPEKEGWYLDPRPSNQLGIIRFVASPLRGGSLTLPSLTIRVENGAAVARTDPFQLSVEELKTDPAVKPELLDVLPVKIPMRYRILLGLVATALVVLGWQIHHWIRRRRKPVPPAVLPPRPQEPAHVLARRRIEELFEAHDLSRESLKKVSFGVSDALKEYFSKRFEIEAREATSGELLFLLRERGLDRNDLTEVRGLFQDLDQFKFLDLRSFPEITREEQLELKERALRILSRWTLQSSVPEATP